MKFPGAIVISRAGHNASSIQKKEDNKMEYSKFVPYQMKITVIEVVSYEERTISGRVINPFYAEPMPFYGMIQLLSLIENVHTELNYPEPTMEMRHYGEQSIKMTLTPCLRTDIADKPAIAVFKVSLFFRQNASWQGSIIWTEKDSVANFRSVLELIYLIDETLLSLT